MQAQRHRAVSKSTTVKEELASVWQLQSGKFDDGIVVIHPDSGAKPEKRGPNLRALMDMFGLTDDDLDKNFCHECGIEHPDRRRFCESCKQKRIQKDLSGG